LIDDSISTAKKPSLRSIGIKEDYNTEDDNIIGAFYEPCFLVSKEYDRAVGYFRASIYRELGEPLLDFALRGGKIRLVCSPDLPKPEEDAARDGYEKREGLALKNISDDLIQVVQEMLKDDGEADCLSMLSALIENGSLDLYIALREKGLYHRKVGCFFDGTDYVAFSGSSNETLNAVAPPENWGNDEEFDVFRSWGSEYEVRKAKKKRDYLGQLFSGGTPNTKVRRITEVEREFLAIHRRFSVLEDGRPGAQNRTKRAPEKCQLYKPFTYQLEAIKAWDNHRRIGILAMATGTGKTATSLFAIKPLVEGGIPVLVVVPSNLLLEQWAKEIQRFYPGVPLLLAGGEHDWKAVDSKRMFVMDIKKPRILLSTMQTASTVDFLTFIAQAKEIGLVADEVHRLGSEQGRKILRIPFTFRLGLSATPERLYDPEGSRALEDAFGKDPVFELQIGSNVRIGDEASTPILGRFLSRYNYFFETVPLNMTELDEWNQATLEIKKLSARASGSEDTRTSPSEIEERIKLLLIKRSRIAKNAENKVRLASEIVKKRYPLNGRWIIYCDNEAQLDDVMLRLRADFPKIDFYKYHSKMPTDQRVSALMSFIDSPSIIVSIRCLDEGVDVPNADGAIILASSKNPREYIQRRGRVLRKAAGKRIATIVDTIVTPPSEIERDVPFSLIKGELVRAWEFARNSENKEVTHDLWDLCLKYNVDIGLDGISGEESSEEE